MKTIEKKIIRWMQKKVRVSKAQGLIFGLSGGIDSAVVAALAKKAVGDKHLALMMPCYSSKASITDARSLIRKLKLTGKKVDLAALYESAMETYPKANQLVCANLKARLRMLTLYFHANTLNYLVVGTGNKSERLMGYYTKYGDGGVDILPIAELLKTQVWTLAKQLGLPKDIIEKPPSADLWSGQTDEEEMGITYEELDDILSCMHNGKQSTHSRAKQNIVKKMIACSEHKRVMPEICKI